MKKERQSDTFCSSCEMPIFEDIDNPIAVLLDPFFGLVFCDLYCCREFMINLSNAEIETIQGP